MKQVQKYIDLGMKFLVDRMPRRAAISVLILAGVLILFAILLPTLGGADDEANEHNASLKDEIAQITKNANQSREDRQFILDNQQKYDDLVHGDRLVPHTRRVAMAQMQKLALQRGLTALSYNFTSEGDRSPTAGAGKPLSGGYKVQVDKVELKVGAPLDNQIYDFVQDLNQSFPGAAVVEQVTMDRAPQLTTDALNQVSRGQDSGLVKGQVVFTWRTAQALDDKSKGKP